MTLETKKELPMPEKLIELNGTAEIIIKTTAKINQKDLRRLKSDLQEALNETADVVLNVHGIENDEIYTVLLGDIEKEIQPSKLRDNR